MDPNGKTSAPSGELVIRARAGDDTAWTELTERYTPMLWSIARAYGHGAADAADIVQLAWLRLVEHIGSLRNPSGVGTWLSVTARREAARMLNASVARPHPEDDWPPLPSLPPSSSAPPTPEAALTDRERLRTVIDAINALPGLCRQLLRLFAASPTYAQVAAALDIPLGSVGPTRTRCLASLRKRLKGSL